MSLSFEKNDLANERKNKKERKKTSPISGTKLLTAPKKEKMAFYIDPAPSLPKSFQSPPEFQQWLNRTFPLNGGLSSNAASASAAAHLPPAAGQLMIVTTGPNGRSGDPASSPSAAAPATARSGTGGTAAELKSAAATASGGALVLVNTRAIEEAERLRSGGGGGGGLASEQVQASRVVGSLEDFNLAYRKAGLARLPTKNNNNNNRDKTSGSDTAGGSQQRRRDRGGGDDDEDKDELLATGGEAMAGLMKHGGKQSKIAQQMSLLKQLNESSGDTNQTGDDNADADQNDGKDANEIRNKKHNSTAKTVHSIVSSAASELPTGAVFASRDHLNRSFIYCPASLSSMEVKHATSTKIPSKLAFAYRTGVSGGSATAATTASAAAAAGPSVQTITWVPPHGHLFVAGDISGCCSIYEAFAGAGGGAQQQQQQQQPRLDRLAICKGHNAPVKEVAFPASSAEQLAASPSSALGSSADKFISCAPDPARPICLWDTETAACISGGGRGSSSAFQLGERYSRAVREAGAHSCAFVPPGIGTSSSGAAGGGGAASMRGDTLVVTGMGSLIVVWDVRSGNRVIDLEGHAGSVHHLSFVQYGRGLLSCSEDKTVRLWDLRSSVPVQEFSEAAMHSIICAVEHPVSGELYMQSNDDRVRCALPLRRRGRPGVLEPATGKYRFVKDREFKGHTISGTGCRLALSKTDGGQVLSSGDTFGNLWMFQVVQEGAAPVQHHRHAGSSKDDLADDEASAPKKNGDLLRKFRAHAKELTVHAWHPVISGMVLTGGRDGLLKMFK